MKYYYKLYLFKILDLLPSVLGYFIYHQIQKVVNTTTLAYKIKSGQNSFNTFQRILEGHGVTLKEKQVLEIGSGWLPIIPYLFRVNGKVAQVDTYDINKHYQQAAIRKLNNGFKEKFRLTIDDFKASKGLLNGVNYFPLTDFRNGNLEKVDIVVSRFVLEHIPKESIEEMHRDLYQRLKSGAFILHLISPSDHRAYTDQSISLYDFLKYSEEQWNKQCTKFDFHNRLRLPHYIELFNKDFEIIAVEYSSCKKGTEQYRQFKALKIHDNFKDFSEEELTAGSINILLKKR